MHAGANKAGGGQATQQGLAKGTLSALAQYAAADVSTPVSAAAARVALPDAMWRATYVAVTSQPQGPPAPAAQFSAPPQAPMPAQQQRAPGGPP